MSVLADRLDSMRIRVSTPDGKIVGELRNRSEVYLSFETGRYRRYDERQLEAQLAGLAKLLWAGRMKGYFLALSEARGETVTREEPPVAPEDVAYHAGRGELVAEGSSADGRVRVSVRGMRGWTVRIADGTVRSLSEAEFAARVREAAGALIRDQLDQIWRLKQQIFRPPVGV